MGGSLSRRLSAVEAMRRPASSAFRVLTCADEIFRDPMARAEWEASQPLAPPGCTTIIIRRLSDQEDAHDQQPA